VSERRTLDRHLSRLGLCSRTVAAELVRAGRVRVNGRATRNPETWLDPQRDAVELDGKSVQAARRLYLLLNKPKGFLTSFGDPDGRRTVYALLADAPAWVFPVGRLDRDTSGLLLLTNDTDLAERVTNPAFGLEKRYRATTRARLEPEELAALAAGPVLDDGPTRPARAELVGNRGPTSVVDLAIHEGRKRQVRRMFLAVGRPLKELRRTGIGPLELGSLASGRWRALTRAELSALRAAVAGGTRRAAD
jgi:23S rRNA pseudouridine2605 synthase